MKIRCQKCGLINDDSLTNCINCNAPLLKNSQKDYKPVFNKDYKPIFNYKYKDKFDFFNPSSSGWLTVFLIFIIAFELLLLVTSLIIGLVNSYRIRYFFIVIGGVLVFHFITMVSLNALYNINTIKETLHGQNQMLKKLIEILEKK